MYRGKIASLHTLLQFQLGSALWKTSYEDMKREASMIWKCAKCEPRNKSWGLGANCNYCKRIGALPHTISSIHRPKLHCSQYILSYDGIKFYRTSVARKC